MKPIRLIPVDRNLVDVLGSGSRAFEACYAVRLGQAFDLILDVVALTLAMPRTENGSGHWGGFLTIDDTESVVVGTCAFKGEPTEEGVVEIAYFTLPYFEHHGYATAMAAQLIELAAGSSRVRRVVAHTLPRENASASVLRKNRLCFAGEHIDPGDRHVWRWEREIHTYQSSSL